MSAPKKSNSSEKLGRMEAHLKVVIGRLDLHQAELQTMNQTLAVNTKQLEIHIEGVKLAREQNELLKVELNMRLQPIEDNFKFLYKFGKLIACLAAFPAILFYCIQLVHSFKG
jgi:hypothetical protein